MRAARARTCCEITMAVVGILVGPPRCLYICTWVYTTISRRGATILPRLAPGDVHACAAAHATFGDVPRAAHCILPHEPCDEAGVWEGGQDIRNIVLIHFVYYLTTYFLLPAPYSWCLLPTTYTYYVVLTTYPLLPPTLVLLPLLLSLLLLLEKRGKNDARMT